MSKVHLPPQQLVDLTAPQSRANGKQELQLLVRKLKDGASHKPGRVELALVSLRLQREEFHPAERQLRRDNLWVEKPDEPRREARSRLPQERVG